MTKEQVKKFNEINKKLEPAHARLSDIEAALYDCLGLSFDSSVKFDITFPYYNHATTNIVISKDTAFKLLKDLKTETIDEINKYEKQIEEI